MHAIPDYSLASWLRELDQPSAGARDELLLGGSGHLLLTAAEEQNIAVKLREALLPRLFEGAQSRPVCVLTGLAPGADLLFTRVVSEWLHEAGIAHRTVGLLPLPINVLLEDWVLVAEASENIRADEIERQRNHLKQTFKSCSAIVDLLPEPNSEQLQSAVFRQSQYRRLAACLAQRSDILVAILRGENPSRPGGTAEVVDWRRNPHKVPQNYSTLPATLESKHYKRRLLLIDPETFGNRSETTAAPTRANAKSYAARATAAMQAGNYVHCYDLAQQARVRGFDSPRLQYLSLLALVNAGSTALAWRRYNELGLRGDERDEDWLALKGRLLKDLALAGLSIETPAEQRRSSRSEEFSADTDDKTPAKIHAGFLRAAQAYLAAHRLTGGHFTAINAATMFQLAGDGERARKLAQEVLAMLDATPAEYAEEIDYYYRCVTEAEAGLLIGDLASARRSLGEADALMRGNFNVRSRTRGQLQLLCEVQQLDQNLPALLSLPEVIRVRRRGDSDWNAPLPHVVLGALIFIVLDRLADLDAAEWLQVRGAHLHIVLPNERSEVLAQWKTRFSEKCAERLQTLLEQAGDITVARGFLCSEQLWSRDYVGALADGLARLDARRLGCQVRELFLDDAETGKPLVEELVPEPLPVQSLRNQQRRFAGLIFADIVGFRRLHDEDLPRFWEVVMGSIARIVERFGTRVLFRSTWGDALHLVTEDATTAAEIAIAIQARFEELRATETGGLADIELRLAAHFAPVFAGHDPVVDTTMFYGSQLAFTARIEPITPPGMIFVTELFAARLVLDAPQRFNLEYVGELALAKLYGSYRIFSLRTVERRQLKTTGDESTSLDAIGSALP
jgi:class 3 adenylate cyclase